MKKLHTGMGRLLVGIAFLGLLARVFVPSGFMAAPLSEGWPVTLCPGQGVELFLATAGQDHSGHHGSHGEDGSEPYPSEESSCPVGAYFSIALELSPAADVVALVEIGEARPTDVDVATAWRAETSLARGPPAVLLLKG